MNDESLSKLLHRANESRSPDCDTANLADRARGQLAGRRKRRRNMAGVGSLLVVGLFSSLLWRGFDQDAVITTPRSVANTESSHVKASDRTNDTDPPLSEAELLAEVARLNAEAEMHAHTARLMQVAFAGLRAERDLRKELRKGDPLDWIHEQQNRTALRMMMRAERMSEQAGSRAEVASTYRRIVELFPRTHTAELARQRLSAAGDMGDQS